MVQTYVVDVRYARVNWACYSGYRIHRIYGEITSLFFLEVRYIYVSRNFAYNFSETLRGSVQRILTGCHRVHLPIEWALSRHRWWHVPPWSLHSSSSILPHLFRVFFLLNSLWLPSFETSFSFHTDQIRALTKSIFCSTSELIFTDTSVPPLKLSSHMQGLDKHRSVQVISFAIVLHIDRHHAKTSRWVQALQYSPEKIAMFPSADEIISKIKVGLDQRQWDRCSSSSSPLFNRVLGTVSCYQAQNRQGERCRATSRVARYE